MLNPKFVKMSLVAMSFPCTNNAKLIKILYVRVHTLSKIRCRHATTDVAMYDKSYLSAALNCDKKIKKLSFRF